MRSPGITRRVLFGMALSLTACKRDETNPVTPPAMPQRIVSQTILSDEVLWTLGDDVRRRVVAVSRLADDAAYSDVAGQWPATVDRAPLTAEALLAAESDLVFIADFTAAETRELLSSARVPTITLTGFSGFADWRRNVTAIADAVGASAEGSALVNRFDVALAERSADSPGGTTVVSWAAGNVAGRGTTFDDVATAAGVKNLAAAHGIDGHKPVTVEQLVAWDPAMIITPCEHTDDQACARAAQRVAQQPGISATAAARTGGIVAVPSRILYSSGWPMLEAVALLRRHAVAHAKVGAP